MGIKVFSVSCSPRDDWLVVGKENGEINVSERHLRKLVNVTKSRKVLVAKLQDE